MSPVAGISFMKQSSPTIFVVPSFTTKAMIPYLEERITLRCYIKICPATTLHSIVNSER